MSSTTYTAAYKDILDTVERFEQSRAVVVLENDEYLKIACLALFGSQEQNEINFNEIPTDSTAQSPLDIAPETAAPGSMALENFGIQGHAEAPVHWTNQEVREFPVNEAPEAQLQHVSLENANDWLSFYRQFNEMKVLTNGRGLFPTLEYPFVGLNPTEKYIVGVKLLLQSPNKYQYRKGQWTQAAKETKNIHWDSNEVFGWARTGEEAMANGFGLRTLKIYNKRSEFKTGPVSAKARDAKTEGMLQVVSQHVYLPQLTLYRVLGDNVHMQVIETAVFPETEFLVVTDYNNPIVKGMKMDNKYVRNDVKEAIRPSVSPTTPQLPFQPQDHYVCQQF